MTPSAAQSTTLTTQSVDYARSLLVAASSDRVYDALTTLPGLRRWWTPRVSGSTESGGELRFEFVGLDEFIRMQVQVAVRPTTVRWLCLEHTALPEWRGTRVLFDVFDRRPGRCELSFRHLGLSPALECFRDCEMGWNHFLASLVASIEQGVGQPFGVGRRKPQ